MLVLEWLDEIGIPTLPVTEIHEKMQKLEKCSLQIDTMKETIAAERRKRMLLSSTEASLVLRAGVPWHSQVQLDSINRWCRQHCDAH